MLESQYVKVRGSVEVTNDFELSKVEIKKKKGENGIVQTKEGFSLQKNFRNFGAAGGVKTEEMAGLGN